MANWKPYSLGVMASAGILLTGVLWHSRQSTVVRGEDLADLLAGVNERTLYAYAYGTNVLTITGTNLVTPYMQFSQLYDGAMCPARTMVTNHFDNGEIKIFWTQSDFLADGAIVAECETEWYVISTPEPLGGITEYYYGVTPSTNATSAIESTDSSKYTPLTQWWPTIKGTNVPFPLVLFPHEKKDVTLHGGDNNWWTHNGFGTNVYKYECERWRNIGSEFLTVTKIGGLGFSNSTDTLEFPLGYLGTKSVSLHSTSTDTNILLASLYEVTGERRDKASFVVSDSGSALTLNLEISTRTIGVNEGSTFDMTIKPTKNPGTLKICNITAVGDYISVDKSTMLFNASNWTNAQTLTVSATENEVAGDTAAIVLLTYESKSSYIAVSINDNDGESNDIRVNPVIASVYKSEATAFSVSLGTVNTNAHIDTSKFITTNNIKQAHDVLNKLNRTIAYIPANLAQCESGQSCDYDLNYEIATNGNFDTPTVETMWANKAADATATTNAAAMGDTLVDGYIWAYQYTELSQTSKGIVEDQQLSSDSFMDAAVTAYRFTNCFLPYPHSQAFASNYVARVAVYAVPYCVFPVRDRLNKASPGPAFSTNITEYLISTNVTASSLDAQTLGLVSYLSLHPSSTWTHTATESWSTEEDSRSAIKQYRVAKLLDVTNSVSVPTFNLGTLEFPNIPIESAMSSEAYTEWGLPSGFSYQWGENYCYSATFEPTIIIKGYIVMVDWKWTNCNYITPYQPVQNIPVWMTTTSTNSP